MPHPSSGPLAGLKVLDLGTFISAPFSATMLAEFGADVIKVEQPRTGDSARTLGKQKDGQPLLWLQEAKNKRAITCDLRHEQGQAIVRDLVAAGYDIVIENFRPGTLERWSLGYDELAETHPGLIMLRISGYGQDGPYAGRPGFGRVANAFGGLTYLAGFPDRPPVNPGSATLADYMSGLFGVVGVLTAVHERADSGLGQMIDVPLYESILRVMDSLVVTYGALGDVRERIGTATALAAPHNHYPSADGGYVAIACSNDRIFGRLCDAMGCPELTADDRFATSWARVQHRDAIDEIVEAWTTSHTRDALVDTLVRYDVPHGPINSVADIFADEHVVARQSIVDVPHDQLGQVTIPAILPRLGRTPGAVRWLGPELGRDTHDVLSQILGRTQQQIEELARQQVIDDPTHHDRSST